MKINNGHNDPENFEHTRGEELNPKFEAARKTGRSNGILSQGKQ